MCLGDGANDGRAQPGSAMTRGARLGATRERMERSLDKLRRQFRTFILDRMMAEPPDFRVEISIRTGVA